MFFNLRLTVVIMDQVQRELDEKYDPQTRAEYRKFVRFIQKLYETENLEVDEETLNSDPCISRGFYHLVLYGGWSIQLLEVHTTCDIGEGPYWYDITRSTDVITALYVPITLRYIELIKSTGFGLKRMGFWGSSARADDLDGNGLDLETVLEQSLQLPPNAENDLWLSLRPEAIFIARHQKELTIRGQKYRRILVAQPALPMASLMKYSCYLRTLIPVTLYYETALLPLKERCFLGKQRMVFTTNEHAFLTSVSPFGPDEEVPGETSSHVSFTLLRRNSPLEGGLSGDEMGAEAIDSELDPEILFGKFGPQHFIVK